MAKTHCTLDTRRFEVACNALLDHSRRSIPDFFREQVRGVIGNVLMVTPPAKKSVSGKAAKKLGEKTIDADVGKVFRKVDKRKATVKSPSEMAALMRPYQNKKMRVRRGPSERITVGVMALREFLRREKKNVGHLASGWNKAASGVGFRRVPAWISRHSGKGGVRMNLKKSQPFVTFWNAVSYVMGVDGIERRLQWAMDKQAEAMWRRLDNYMDRWAKKVGLSK